MSHHQHQSCIDACYSCASECDHCTTACLKEEDVKMLSRCIELDLYCADICRTAATFMARSHEFVDQICAVCADICDACATECDKHSHMEHCARCADACRRCAEECRAMAGQDH